MLTDIVVPVTRSCKSASLYVTRKPSLTTQPAPAEARGGSYGTAQ
jgi:hypothetical protein